MNNTTRPSVFWMLPAFLLYVPLVLTAQSAYISEETVSLTTYAFSDPDPVPILADNPKIFPYFKFHGYEQTPQKKDWKVVTLENEYIKVFVLPEIGGKIWGAVEKSTGEEFLYKNEVIKFRNIAMRGPWTSGGIEFNFGLIGHSPQTATPVNYLTRKNGDGSVSCIVGTMDLTSRTTWGVEIRLEADKAYVETQAHWYNGTPLNQSYYNWMTAAAEVAEDLEFFYPGDQYLEHSGEVHPWPLDREGRNTAFYKNNDYGPAKSKHVVGTYQDFFGGYYHDRQFGFGHWAPYEEMPGQKLWLWALSRSGGIWEDLLTDTDGQYMEFQAGRLFNQYSPGAVNPISQANFDPYVMDRWREIWFPYKKIGGMVDASEHGVLNVVQKNGELRIGLNALQHLDQTLVVYRNGEPVHSEPLDLRPMEVYQTAIPIDGSHGSIRVAVSGTDLDFSNDSEALRLKRPFNTDETIKVSKTEQLYTNGWEALKFRDYQGARTYFKKLLAIDPYHQDGLVKMAELQFRMTQYEKALVHANTALKIDTYNPGANYFAGLAYRTLNDTINALESFGWAARDIKYRTAGFTQMAELYLASKNYGKARTYGQKALNFNTFNLNARYVIALAARKLNDTAEFGKQIRYILEIDALNPFALLEKARRESSPDSIPLSQHLSTEFPEETVLELALLYYRLGLTNEAAGILAQRSETVKNKLWRAFLLRATDSVKSRTLLGEAVEGSDHFVFPYRRETLPVLEWANRQTEDWKLNYYLAQNYLAVGRDDEGAALLKSLENTPDSDVFYRFRAEILKNRGFDRRWKDYQNALELNPSDWKVWEENIQFLLENQNYQQAYTLARKAFKKYPNNYSIGLAYSKASVNTEKYAEVIGILERINVLPYEHARESREIYERAYTSVALDQYQKENYEKAARTLQQSKKWPENIGVGRPYTPDEREQDYLLAMVFKKLGKWNERQALLTDIVTDTQNWKQKNSLNHVFGLLAAKKLNSKSVKNLKKQLRDTISEDHALSKMALAIFEGNQDKIMEYKAQNILPPDVIRFAETLAKL